VLLEKEIISIAEGVGPTESVVLPPSRVKSQRETIAATSKVDNWIPVAEIYNTGVGGRQRSDANVRI